MNTGKTTWVVKFNSRASKQKAKLPQNIDDILAALVMDLTLKGPV